MLKLWHRVSFGRHSGTRRGDVVPFLADGRLEGRLCKEAVQEAPSYESMDATSSHHGVHLGAISEKAECKTLVTRLKSMRLENICTSNKYFNRSCFQFASIQGANSDRIDDYSSICQITTAKF